MPSQTPPPSVAVPAAGAPVPPRIHLDYLDGVRAIAALYVCLQHAMITGYHLHAPVLEGIGGLGRWVLNLFWQGHFAVSVFIVLSGYCLMLPIARRGDDRLPGGTVAFLRRRARRILPPYYMALVLSILLTIIVPGMRHPGKGYWSAALPIWDWGGIISHLFLFQNWSWKWAFRIDPPAWSVATESQIYLIFAFVLLPIARRVGVAGTALIALWAGLEIHWYFHAVYDYIYWSYVGLFSLGMLGASINFSAVPWAEFCRERLPWGAFNAFAWAALARLTLSPGQFWIQDHAWLVDPLLGGAMLCLLVYCTRALAGPSASQPPLLVRVLQFRPLVQLGVFSYSFYLVHFPVVIVLSLLLQSLGVPYPMIVWWILVLSVPVSVPAAYGFYLLFERPFMRSHPTTADQAARMPASLRFLTAWNPMTKRSTFGLLAVGIVTLLAWNSREFFFGRPYYEYYDWAANSLLIERAKHFDDLYGPYSRFSFHHPGPAFFYVFALGEALFYNALHIVPAPYQGQVLINLCLVTGFYVAALGLFARWLPVPRRWAFVCAALGFGIVHFSLMGRLPSCDIMGGPSAFVSIWSAHLIVMPFICLLAAGASVGAGRGRHLPLLVLAGGFLMVHISQPIFVGPTAVLAYLGLVAHCVARRRATGEKPARWSWPLAAWREHPRAHLVAGAFLFILLLPMLLDLAWGSESNFADILRYTHTTAHEPHKTWARSAVFFVQFGAYASYHADQPGRWDFGHYDLAGFLTYLRVHALVLTGWLLVLGCMVRAIFVHGRTLVRREPGASPPDPAADTRRFLAWASVMVGLNTGLSLFWGTRQTGPICFYLSWCNFSILYCAALIALGVLCTWRRAPAAGDVGAAVGTTFLSRSVLGRLASVGVLALAAYLFADQLRIHEYAPEAMRAMHAAVKRAVADSEARHPGTCKVLVVPDSTWPLAAATSLQLNRAGVPQLVSTGRWQIVFDAHTLWENHAGPSPAAGLSPFYVHLEGQGRAGVPSDAATYSLTHGMELTLTPPSLAAFPGTEGSLDLGFVPDADTWKYALAGWAGPEPGGTWSQAPWAALAFRPQAVKGSGVEVLLEGFPYLAPAHGVTRQRVRLRCNGSLVGSEQSLTGPGALPFVIPAAGWNAAASGRDPQISLVFEFPDAVVPAKLDPGHPDGDGRDLAVFFRKVRLRVMP